MIRQLGTLDSGDMAANDSITRAYAAACSDLKTALMNWTAINGADPAAFNAVLAKSSLEVIAVSAP